MRDFPPVLDTFYARGGGQPTAAPDTRTPMRFLLWMLRIEGGDELREVWAKVRARLPGA